MKTLIIVALTIAGTLYFTSQKPSQAIQAGQTVERVTKQGMEAAKQGAKEARKAIHSATAEGR